jgi:hypothetical protein
MISAHLEGEGKGLVIHFCFGGDRGPCLAGVPLNAVVIQNPRGGRNRKCLYACACGRREGYGDGVRETGWGEFHALSNKVLQGGSSALNHHVFVAKEDHKAVLDVLPTLGSPSWQISGVSTLAR